MEWCSFFETSSVSFIDFLTRAEASIIKVFRLSAAEDWWLLDNKKLLGLVTSLLLGLGSDEWALIMVADVLLDLLLFVRQFLVVLTSHHRVHGRELPVRW